MKPYCLALLVFTALFANAQSEFANNRFTDAFKKLYADAPNGFAQYKGGKMRSMGSLFNIHKSLSLLPGADSAIVSVPLAYARPSSTHYFAPSATLAAAQQRETALASAIKSVVGKTLYQKKAVDSIGRFVFYRTQMYNNAKASVFDLDLETYIVLERGRYQLALIVYGKTPPPAPSGKSKLPAEPDLQGKINNLFTALQNLFASEKGTLIETTQYYKAYQTIGRLYGQTGKIKERTFETSISFSLDGGQLDGPAEAKLIYEKIKAAFAATGRCRFNPETVEGSRTWFFASDAGNNAIRSKFTLVVDYYNDAYNPSVSFLLTAKR